MNRGNDGRHVLPNSIAALLRRKFRSFTGGELKEVFKRFPGDRYLPLLTADFHSDQNVTVYWNNHTFAHVRFPIHGRHRATGQGGRWKASRLTSGHS